MPIWYRVADVFCLPSRGPGETWGLAVNEALACGCSVIVSDRVGCAEDLVKGKSLGAVFSWNNIEELGATISHAKNLLSKDKTQITGDQIGSIQNVCDCITGILNKI